MREISRVSVPFALAATLSLVVVAACTSSQPAPSTPLAEVADGTDRDPPSVSDSGQADPADTAHQTSLASEAEFDQVSELTDDDPQIEVEDAVIDEEPQPDPSDLQQEALELCQSAEEFLDRGELEDATAALDRAYELMLELPNHGDEDWLQAKDDLRILVAQLLIRTYDSQRSVATSPTTSWDLEIQVVENDHVQREIRSFTGPEREAFLEAYRRSGRYRPMIVAKLQEAGLPSQLSWLPLVESQFKDRALSRAGALGLWQFIASTGLRYGLSRDGWMDERMSPEEATDGAIAYLTALHGLFGDWPKALAAYNCGEARLLHLQRRQPDAFLDFWDLYELLPRETRRYVPRFFATLAILEDPERYGVELPELLPPLPQWIPVTISKSIQLSTLDEKLGLEKGTMALLNPELRQRATPPRNWNLKVPVGVESDLVAALDSIPEWTPPQPQFATHRVSRGETLSGIARRYGTSISAIMGANNLRSANRISPGQRLQIPLRSGSRSSRRPPTTFNSAEGTHRVRSGESLYTIARRYQTTVARLRQDNGLTSNTIYPGQKLKVAPGSRGDLRRYQVAKGDTLSQIADRHRVALSALLRANGMSSRSTIFPGQWLVIP